MARAKPVDQAATLESGEHARNRHRERDLRDGTGRSHDAPAPTSLCRFSHWFYAPSPMPAQYNLRPARVIRLLGERLRGVEARLNQSFCTAPVSAKALVWG